MTEKEFKEAKIKPGDWVITEKPYREAIVDYVWPYGTLTSKEGFSIMADEIRRVYHPQFKVGDVVTLSVNKTHQIMTVSRITKMVPDVITPSGNDGFAYYLDGCQDYYRSTSLVKLLDSTDDTTGCCLTAVDVSTEGSDRSGLTVIDLNNSIECGFKEYESNLYKNWQLSALDCKPVAQAKGKYEVVLNTQTDETAIKKGITIEPRKKIKLNFKN